MADHPALALAAAFGIGLVSFALLEAWTGALFDGTARSVIGPLLLVGATAAASAVWITQRWGPGLVGGWPCSRICLAGLVASAVVAEPPGTRIAHSRLKVGKLWLSQAKPRASP